ncbi:MAG: DUF898 family protein [Ruminococcaceae bacterium]|nr:DUF898 family protein [Oscillospiraceae bacterium]
MDSLTRTTVREDSRFDGNTLQLIGRILLAFLVTTITLGIAFPWMLCMMQRWQTKHTVINGRRLKFTGRGHQLIGRYILWSFLTIITLGIYSIWFGLGVKKWIVKHTVYADEDTPAESFFSGKAGGYLGIHILAALLTSVTLGIGAAWAETMVLRWEAKHTHIGGSPLVFVGTGGQLFVKYLVLGLLTPITLGIYAIFFPVKLMKWQTKNTEAVYQTPEIQAKARAHEITAVQDFAKFRIAANDSEIAAMKSGYTGKEDRETLEKMAAENNSFALYALAKLEKGESEVYEGRALELLEKAAEGKYHKALLDLAKQSPDRRLLLLTEAAKQGSAEASFLLAEEHKKAGNLVEQAYWHKIAMEWGTPEAVSSEAEYEKLVKQIALNLAESTAVPSKSSALVVILAILGGLVLVGGIAAVVCGLFLFNMDAKTPASVENTELAYVETVDAENINGTEYTIFDAHGNDLTYVIDDEVIFDNEKGILYIQFALKEYENYVYLRGEDGWRTQAIRPGEGITEVSYSSDYAPWYIEIHTKSDETDGYFLTGHSLEVREGTTAEAEKWLNDKYGITEGTEYITEDVFIPEDTDEYAPEATPLDILDGTWVCYDMVTNMYTGENELQKWSYFFNSFDYGCSFSHNEFMETDETEFEYIFGSYWMCVLGSSFEGTYEVDGNRITAWVTNPTTGEAVTRYLTYEFVGENLVITDENGIPRTCEKVQ